jgi:hypothetical protein
MVEAATRCPSRRNLPWIRTTPHRRFSLANRTFRSTRSSPIGGRPGALGCVHCLATRRLCQRSSVPGVAIRRSRSRFGRIRASAASTARSGQDRRGQDRRGQDRRGRGLVRRSTATSWRSANISASLDGCDRANSASHDITVTNTL